ncbi:hypothetical protein NIES970_29210 (plasmid) [[Synechococcus] sp. NIES-970]|nr:hypothetical protein NIES970_29210 [[Synechococcus] sp. NIES-970]
MIFGFIVKLYYVLNNVITALDVFLVVKMIFISMVDPQIRRFFTVGAIAQGMKPIENRANLA